LIPTRHRAAASTASRSTDGRETDPDEVTSADPRTATLSDLIGDSAAGEWTLFVADLGFDNQSTLQSWTMNITAIPEPTVSFFLSAFASLAILRRSRRRQASPFGLMSPTAKHPRKFKKDPHHCGPF
jgi:hypothetical protein